MRFKRLFIALNSKTLYLNEQYDSLASYLVCTHEMSLVESRLWCNKRTYKTKNALLSPLSPHFSPSALYYRYYHYPATSSYHSRHHYPHCRQHGHIIPLSVVPPLCTLLSLHFSQTTFALLPYFLPFLLHHRHNIVDFSTPAQPVYR